MFIEIYILEINIWIMSLNWIDYTFSREKLTVSTQRNNHLTIIANFIETIETGRYSKDKNTGYWDYVWM